MLTHATIDGLTHTDDAAVHSLLGTPVRGGVLELRAVNKYEGMNLDELSAILEKRRARR